MEQKIDLKEIRDKIIDDILVSHLKINIKDIRKEEEKIYKLLKIIIKWYVAKYGKVGYESNDIFCAISKVCFKKFLNNRKIYVSYSYGDNYEVKEHRGFIYTLYESGIEKNFCIENSDDALSLLSIIKRMYYRLPSSFELYIRDLIRDINKLHEQKIIDRRKEEINLHQLILKNAESAVIERIKETINEKYPDQTTLIKIWIDIFIFKTKTIEQFKQELEIRVSEKWELYFYDNYATKYIRNYFEELSKVNKLYKFCYGIKGKIELLTFLYDGEDNLKKLITYYWKDKKMTSKQISNKLNISITTFYALINDLKLQYPNKLYYMGKMLIDPDEVHIEKVLLKHGIRHVWQPKIEQYEFIYYEDGKKKRYKPDWVIEINGKICIMELFKSNKDTRTKRKIKYFSNLPNYRFIAFYKNEVQNPETILNRIEETMGFIRNNMR